MHTCPFSTYTGDKSQFGSGLMTMATGRPYQLIQEKQHFGPETCPKLKKAAAFALSTFRSDSMGDGGNEAEREGCHHQFIRKSDPFLPWRSLFGCNLRRYLGVHTDVRIAMVAVVRDYELAQNNEFLLTMPGQFSKRTWHSSKRKKRSINCTETPERAIFHALGFKTSPASKNGKWKVSVGSITNWCFIR